MHPRLYVGRRVDEVRGHHADDEIALVVERDRTTDDGVVATEALLPIRVAEDDDPIVSGLLFVPEGPTQVRRPAEDIEEACRDVRHTQLRGLAVPRGQRTAGERRVDGEFLQRAARRDPVTSVG